MTKSITARGGDAWTVINIASSTRYQDFAGFSGTAGQSASATVETKWPVAGTLSQFAVRVSANGRGTSTTLRTCINGSLGSQTLTVPASTTGWFEDTSNTDSISANDLLCWAAVSSTGTGTLSATHAQIVFEASSGARQIWVARDTGAFNQSATLAYNTVNGGTSSNGTWILTRAPDAGTWSRLACYISSNTLTTSITTLRSVINGSNGNQIVQVPAGSTGWFEDTTNSDTIAQSDTLTISRQGNGTGSGLGNIGVVRSMWSPTNGRMLGGSSSALSRSMVASATRYLNLWGGHAISATESDVQSKVPYACEAGRFRLRIISGPFTTASATFRLKINGSYGNASITVPVSTNGAFEDTTNTDTIAAGDALAVEHVNSGISGTAYVSELAVDLYVQADILLEPDPGSIEITGGQPIIGTVLGPDAGSLEITGGQPAITFAIGLHPGAGDIEITGGEAEVRMTAPAVSQAVTESLVGVDSTGRMALAEAEVLAEVIPEGRASLALAEVLAEIIPAVRMPESVIEVLGDGVACLTKWQQLWRITRKDGEVLCFTSLDRDFVWGSQTFRACASLDPSAAESAATIGQIGSQDLRGVIADDAVSEADLWAGLYDDAFVEVWLVPWEGTDTPRRLAAGWTGQMTQDDAAFNIEVLGPGKRIDQQALVQVFTPGCRWLFGDHDTCGVDIEAMARPGTVTGSTNRHRFFATIGASSGPATAQWANGTVIWETGDNAGATAEVRAVDFVSGTIDLWVPAGFRPAAGDEFRLLPGCDRLKPTCQTIYGNYGRYGGFWDIPGEDAILETPDSKL